METLNNINNSEPNSTIYAEHQRYNILHPVGTEQCIAVHIAQDCLQQDAHFLFSIYDCNK